MTIAALKGIFMQAKGYTRGRSAKVIYLGVHTAEGSTTVTGLGGYFAGTTKGSSNAGMGQKGEYAEYVTYNNTPWTNPPINSSSDTLEICGFAKWTRAEWLAHTALIDNVAHWIAWRCAVRGIPIIHRSKGDKRTGVYGHLDVNAAWHKSTHTDPGPNFPWDVIIAKAAALARVPATPVPVVKASPKPVVKAGVKAPVYPLPHGSYFGPKTGPASSVSGYYSHAADLKAWQAQMLKRGWKISVDGHFDVGRDDVVVRAFQKDKGLPQDGLLGPAVWALAWTSQVTK